MFIADVEDAWDFSSFRCAELTIRGRWELVHKRAVRGYYAKAA